MEEYSPIKGGTLLGNVGGPKDHLFILRCDPVYYPRLNLDAVLTVNVTSWCEGKINDSACIINIGDHPFIVHKSYIFYQKAKAVSSFSLKKGVEDGYYKPQALLSDEVMGKIIQGFEVSDLLSDEGERFFNFLRKYGKI